MPNPIANITTPRMLAEAITPLHFHDLHRLYTEAKVVKTLASVGKPLTEDAVKKQIDQNVAHWQEHGFGYWVFHLKKDGQFVGRGGLTTHQFEGKEVVGLGYAIMPDYWNRGFATEIAAASLEVGFGHLGLAEIWSWALPHNRASQRVMEKLGFRYEHDFDFAGLVHRFYRLVAKDRERYHGKEMLSDLKETS
jgi:RimJ/RimL family protein N-acetyltransferase